MDVDPNAVAPVATAFVLAPLVMIGFAPLPAIGVNAHAELRLVFDMLSGVPAFTFAITDDFCR